MDRLGLTNRTLSKRSGVSRNTIAAAREGKSTPTTYGRLEKALDVFEHETGADIPDDTTATIDLPDGTKVTFSGVTAEQAVEFVNLYLQKTRNVDPPG